MELALKVASKIKARERFAVYIIIPLWPEGDPKDTTVQEILYWQVGIYFFNHISWKHLISIHYDKNMKQQYNCKLPLVS